MAAFQKDQFLFVKIDSELEKWPFFMKIDSEMEEWPFKN